MKEIPPPLTRVEVMELVMRCESLIRNAEGEVTEVSVEDLSNLCERVRTFMQLESYYAEIVAILKSSK